MDERLKNIAENYERMIIGLDDTFRFHCTRCGKCCINREDILLNALDVYNLAKELKVCIVALSQLNREAKDSDPRPSLSKLKGSGGIEQAADTIVFVYRPGYYGKRHKYRPDLDPDSTAEMIIGKGRNIGVGTSYVGFRAENTYFFDLDSNEPTPIPEAEQQPLPF